jgi:hypothetical protein
MIGFSRRRSLGRFFLFGLSIYDDWIESPTIVVITRLYDDNSIDSPHPRIPASLGRLPRSLRRGVVALGGCCAYLGRLSQSSCCVCPCRHHPGHHQQHRQRLRSPARRPHHGTSNTTVGLVNRSHAHLHQTRSRARAYLRSSIGLPLCLPFGQQSRRLLVHATGL